MIFGVSEKRHRLAQNIRQEKRNQIFKARREEVFQEKSNQDKESKWTIIDLQYENFLKRMRARQYILEELPQLCASLNSESVEDKYYGLTGIRKIVSEQQPPIQYIIDRGAIPHLLNFLEFENWPQLVLESIAIISRIVSGESEECRPIIEKDGINKLLKSLKGKHEQIISFAIQSLGNIAADSILYRDKIIKNGGIQNIILAIEQNKKLTEEGCWAIANLCRGKPLPHISYIEKAVIYLGQVLVAYQFSSRQTLTEVTWAIATHIQEFKQKTHTFFSMKIYIKLLQFISGEWFPLILPSLHILEHLSTSHEQEIQQMIHFTDFFEKINQILVHERKNCRIEGCWIVSNIFTQNNLNHIFIHQEKMINNLLCLLERGDSQVRIPALSLFGEVCKGSNKAEIFFIYCQKKIIKIFLIVLQDEDPQTLIECLNNLYCILSLGEDHMQNSVNFFVSDIINYGGASILENLQNHPNKKVYESLIHLMARFFELTDSHDL